MKLWKRLSPLGKHLVLGITAAIAVLCPPMLTGRAPNATEFWMAAGAGLMASFGLSLPSPSAAPRNEVRSEK